jgi:hypothetical protein
MVGLEVRDMNPGTSVYKAYTLAQPGLLTISLFCFLCRLLLYALMSWYPYVISFEVLFVCRSWRQFVKAFFLLQATLLEDVRCSWHSVA